MRTLSTCIFTLLFVYTLNVNGQNYQCKVYDIPMISLVNDDFISILDTVINYEKKNFKIQNGDTLTYTVTSYRMKGRKKRIVLSRIDDFEDVFEIPSGFFYFKGHLFFVNGKFEYLAEKPNSKIKQFKFIDYQGEGLIPHSVDIVNWYFEHSKKGIKFKFINEYRI